MIGWIAPTDYDWFSFLATQPGLEEVNFWTPSTHFAFRSEPGTPFFFKLKSPHNAIAGFGYFARYDPLPEFLAWDCFGVGNGAPSFQAMKTRLEGIRARNNMAGATGLEQIGCIVLANPVFFPKENWIPQPTNWPPRNLRPMRYDLTQGEGRRIWDDCLPLSVLLSPGQGAPAENRWGEPTLVRPRLGQGAFRLAVTAAYGRACAMTEEHSLPALEASHIKPFAMDGPHDVSNGILLRSDLHRLFDTGYITVTPDYRIHVSDVLKEHFQNGKSYYPYQDRPLAVIPDRPENRPNPELLRWHNEVCFKRRA